ncbi:MAG: AI-2E family transporter [Phycisphaerae bacterium]|nr:AI-2E family transporter [Phycisphaerae bacterium]
MAKKKSTRRPRARPEAADAPPESANVAQDFANLHVWQIQAFRDILLVAAIVALVWAGYALRAVTVPLLVALLLAYLFEPLIARLSQHPRVSRPTAILGLLGTVGVVVVLLIALTLPTMVRQTTQLVTDLRDERVLARLVELQEAATSQVDRLLGVFSKDETTPDGPETPVTGESDEESAPDGPIPGEPEAGTTGPPVPNGPAVMTEEQVRDLIDERIARERARVAEAEEGGAWWFTPGTGRVARGGWQAISRMIGAVVGIGLMTFLIPFYFFFFSLWYHDVLEFFGRLIPESKRPRTLELLQKMDFVVAGFVRGRIVISLIMGLMLAIGWMICGVPSALVVGLVVGIFCAVPYLGVVGIPLAVGLLVLEQLGLPEAERMGWLWVVLWPTVVFVIVQLIEGWVLTPLIAGKATNLDPVTVLVAVLAGGSVLGIYGMLLAIPLAACGKILLTEVVLPKVNAWTRGEARDPLPLN